jgi:hypothetical protein
MECRLFDLGEPLRRARHPKSLSRTTRSPTPFFRNDALQTSGFDARCINVSVAPPRSSRSGSTRFNTCHDLIVTARANSISLGARTGSSVRRAFRRGCLPRRSRIRGRSKMGAAPVCGRCDASARESPGYTRQRKSADNSVQNQSFTVPAGGPNCERTLPSFPYLRLEQFLAALHPWTVVLLSNSDGRDYCA